MPLARQSLTSLWVAVCMAACAGAAWAAPEVIKMDPVAQRANDLRDRFVSAIQSCGARPTYLPNIVVDTPENGSSYYEGDHSVHESRWSKLPPPVQTAMENWAAAGALGLDAQGQFGEIFNDLLVPHELGHWLEYMSGRIDGMDDWDAEIEANGIALAFFAREGQSPARLQARVENFTRFLQALPSPVPAGRDARAYFQSHYEQLTTDIAAYGWYQGQFMQAAWKRRGARDFCAWVALNPPKPPRRGAHP